jgi:hypothetical protein
MITDALVSFIPLGSALSLVGAAGATFRSGIIDLLGQGVGTAPANIIGTGRTVFGTDLGVGGNRPELNITIGTALAAAAGTTLKVALQAAIDNGSYQPGTWTDVDSEDNISLANGTAGAVIFRSPWIPTFPPGLMPRFLSLLFSPQLAGATPSGDFTAGTISSALVTMVRDDYAAKYANKNFTVA